MSARVDNEPCYVLHRRPYGESRFIVDLFTMHHGRMSGILRSSSKSRGGNPAAKAQIAQALMVSWSGRGTLKNLIQVEAPSAALPLQGKSLYCVYYLNELLMRLLAEQDNHEDVFYAYVAALEGFTRDRDIEWILRRFELTLLRSLGLAPDFEYTVSGSPVSFSTCYQYVPGDGFLPEENGPYDAATLQWCAEQVCDGSSENFGADEDGSDEESSYTPYRRQLKQLMRVLIDEALQGRTLNSRAMMRQLMGQTGRGEE